MTFDEFKQWHAPGAIPFSERSGVMLSAPVGWVVDGQRRQGTLAFLYRRGLTLEDAGLQHEFMYVNIWDRRHRIDSLDALLEHQRERIRDLDPDALITVRELALKHARRGAIRRMETPKYPTAEITGFVEFRDSIFFVVLFTRLVVERRNVRKLEYILDRALPLSVEQPRQ